MYIALALFAVTYVLMLVFSKYRPYIALASGLIFIVSGMLMCYEAHLFHSIIDALQRVPIMGRAVGDFHCPYFGITQSEQQKNRKDGSDATQPEKR